MRKRVYIALAVLLVMLAGVIAWQVLRQREPVYQGKQLSFWLERLNPAAANQEEADRAQQAIRHIGTDALPFLAERLQAQDTRLKRLMMTWADRQKLVHFHFKSAEQRQHQALFGYQALGPLASAQVASLSDILTNAPTARVRVVAAWALEYIGPEARLAAPALFRAAQDTNVFVRDQTFLALGQILPDSQTTIPVLVVGLDDPFSDAQRHAVSALQRYGPAAKAAVPVLLRMLATNNAVGLAQQRLHATASFALKAIDPAAFAKAGVK